MSDPLYPLFFTLEKVTNGYILTSKKETGSLVNETEFMKEIVTEDKINSRIGQLLHLDKMLPEKPRVFYVEAVTEDVYRQDAKSDPDTSIDARRAFVHFHSKENSEGWYVALEIADKGVIELYGDQAMSVSEANSMPVSRKGMTPYIQFENNLNGKKMLASYCNNQVRLMTVTSAQIEAWYAEHNISNEVKT